MHAVQTNGAQFQVSITFKNEGKKMLLNCQLSSFICTSSGSTKDLDCVNNKIRTENEIQDQGKYKLN